MYIQYSSKRSKGPNGVCNYSYHVYQSWYINLARSSNCSLLPKKHHIHQQLRQQHRQQHRQQQRSVPEQLSIINKSHNIKVLELMINNKAQTTVQYSMNMNYVCNRSLLSPIGMLIALRSGWSRCRYMIKFRKSMHWLFIVFLKNATDILFSKEPQINRWSLP